MKETPFNTIPPQSGQPDKYIPYRNTRNYIHKKYQAVSKKAGKRYPEDINVWMLLMGYKNKSKFLRRLLEQWLRLRGKVPSEFLCLIEVDLDELVQMEELDKKEFRAALAKAPIPQSFSQRLMAAVYRDVKFPESISTEAEAIDYIQTYLAGMHKSIQHACFTCAGLKTIFCTPTGHFVVLKEPEIKFSKNFIELERNPHFGVSFIR